MVSRIRENTLVDKSGCLLKSMIVKVVIDIPLFHLCRSYEDPSPAFRVVSNNVSSLILGIQFSLRRGINLNCKFNVEFRLDVLVTPLVGKVVSLHLENENYNSDEPTQMSQLRRPYSDDPTFFLLIGLLYTKS